MVNESENSPECIGGKSYYLYSSRKDGNYVIIDNALEAFDNFPWIDLKDEKISDLIKLLQNHGPVLTNQRPRLENNKVNLSANSEYIQDIKKKISPGQASPL